MMISLIDEIYIDRYMQQSSLQRFAKPWMAVELPFEYLQ